MFFFWLPVFYQAIPGIKIEWPILPAIEPVAAFCRAKHGQMMSQCKKQNSLSAL
ncbi:hypothetical protein PCH70_36550 [Pseudomonas cichorii JBC1]|nr:hypothetical protein PCH70_36550 [Pseudomonas cichorii JBC1]